MDVVGDPEQQLVHFTVWDTGIGISLANIDHLFQPFVQLDSGLARQRDGTGLGLSLVYRLAKLHGGNVLAESEGPDQGSRFVVSLPWRQTEEAIQAAELKDALSTTTLSPTLIADLHPSSPPTSPLLLLAEDNEANLKILSDYLTARGYRLVTARDGGQVLTLAREACPDLILMDMQMPSVDGIEATRLLRADPDLSTTPIIALTALAMPGDRERCLQAGVNAYLSKPINLPVLVELITEQLQTSNRREGG
jgi:CheY-like chemotaxis protein